MDELLFHTNFLSALDRDDCNLPRYYERVMILLFKFSLLIKITAIVYAIFYRYKNFFFFNLI